MQISNDKAFLREKFRQIRSSVKAQEKDENIRSLFCASEIYRNAETLFIYYSVKNEVDTLKIIDLALKQGKKVALPKCTDRNGNMDFYFIESTDSSLTDGYFSLKEPNVSVCKKAAYSSKDVCVLPALACDKKGFRLGYGGGYYDRFLSRFEGKTVAFCYDECLCDELPTDRFDKKVDMIITDLKIYDLK
ncbi:MAG: 5-formyltetrahydrofolate cyclo-ligase [Ruminococcaceae bacterium]|nr:5-formyltetrahydrofolate cyclo-ligase [Oscillospiraceae bacterium]MBQ9913140.1 5-formyltetrahydrofolate cyclo-ligase [Clostridia bacterium]